MSKIILNNENVILKISNEGTYAHVVGTGKECHWEECSETIARQDYVNRKIADNEIIDGGILFPESKMVMSFSTGANQIIEIDVPEHVVAQEYKYENGEFIINTPVRIAKIKDELIELDTIINRATEDLYVATGTAAYANVQEVINRKNELRTELAQLEA